MKALSSNLRNMLERTVTEARKVAEEGAEIAIKAIAVHHYEPYKHQTPEERKLRVRLRAHARQLGDKQSPKAELEIGHIVHECAYGNWHRMLFARFLAENNLLIEPESGIAISLDECEELARNLGVDEWELAAEYAQRMLPQIFRTHDPVMEIELAREHRLKLERLLQNLSPEVFKADDSLGWVYQFWQSQKKKEVNESGCKIGADELPAVTQLFTENYMVLFLLHNTIGAWWAGKKFKENPDLAKSVRTEDELRRAVSLPEVDWQYLRFIREDDGKGTWRPAAGTFDGWPKEAKDVTILDPCMGSGHFLVAAFQIMVPILMEEEGLSLPEACDAVLSENLYGLEIDARCSQIAAFALAFTAWKMTGFRELPRLNLACSGIGIHSKLDDWLALGNDVPRLKGGMERLYHLFKDAPTLGSLIDPQRALGTKDLFVADFGELQPLFQKALGSSKKEEDESVEEIAVTAQGITHAAEILSSSFTLIATNVPYLGQGKQEDVLKEYCRLIHPDAKADISTCFVERCLSFCAKDGTAALVAPQNWLFLKTYKKLRKSLLETIEWDVIARLGPKAFQTPMWDFNVALLLLTHRAADVEHIFAGLDVSEEKTPRKKRDKLKKNYVSELPQNKQLKNPDAAISLLTIGTNQLLADFADSYQGASTVDIKRFRFHFWEVFDFRLWNFHMSTPAANMLFSGCEYVSYTRREGEAMALLAADMKEEGFLGGWLSGNKAWGKRGVACSWMAKLPASLYLGCVYDNMAAVIVPKKEEHLLPIWTYCSSPDFHDAVRRINQKVQVANATLVQVPFDLEYWQEVAAEKYPGGLPKPHSDDPTQWLFNGHPKGSDEPLQVAVARLLGYQWPRQTGSSFTDCPALEPDGLVECADEDGIVCISSIRGEETGASRLRALLSAAFGKDWSPAKERELVKSTGSSTADIEQWLYNDFFEQHCKLFHHRPFIWHIWDGRARDGFHALVNYHKLAEGNGQGRRLLEKLIYSYLGDWIKRQEEGVNRGEAGSEVRLVAANTLRDILENILEGEPPYDIFVRWKPAHEQAIGWEPDINDGVRLNIRPFMSKDLPKGKKGAGVLRWKPNMKWKKDRGKEPGRPMDEFPWFFGWDESEVDFKGKKGGFDANRWNGCHYTNEFKRKAREEAESK